MHTPLGHKKLPLPALDKLDSCEQAVHDEPWSTCSPDYQFLLSEFEKRKWNTAFDKTVMYERIWTLTLEGSGHRNPAIYILLKKLHSKQAPKKS